MGITPFPNGISSFGAPVFPSGKIPQGNVFWVSSTTGSNSLNNGDYNTPFASLAYAITKCKANNDDLVYVMNGHTETVASAGGLTFSIAGMTVVFLGQGSKRGTITFTDTAATMVVTGANVTLINPRFLTGIDAVAAAINVQAADFQMYNAEYYDAAAMATTIQVLTTAAANRMVIDGYRFYVSTTGTQKTDGIKIVGGTGVTLKNIEIEGDFSVGCIDNATTAGTNWYLENVTCNNLNSSPTAAMVVQANTTGFAKKVKLRVASGTTFASSYGKINWDLDCEGFSTDGYNGQPLGTANASGYASLLTNNMRVATKDLAAADLTGTATRFTVAGGPIKITALGLLITTVLPAGANTLKFQITPTGGSATDLCGATDTASAAVRTIFSVDGVKATALVKSTDPGVAIASALHMPIYVSTGIITTVFSAGPPASGAGTVFMEYEPMASGVTVTAS